MRSLKIVTICVIAAVRYLPAQVAPLTLEDCQSLAEQAPSSITAARLETQVAQAGVSVARSAFLPHSALTSGYTYNTPLASQQQAFIALNGVREYQIIGAATLELDTSGRLRASLARAKADHDIAGAHLTITRRDLRRAVASAYYRTLLARHLLDATEASLAEASSFRARTQALFAGGEVARADLLKAESQVAFLQQAQIAAELEAQIANQELASFWTADVSTRLQLEDTLSRPEAPQPESQPDVWLRRPEFQLFAAESRGFQADFRRERAALFPQVGLVYQYGLDASGMRINDRGSAAFVTLNMPVFDWFRISNTAQQSQFRVQQTEANRTAATRAATRDYQNAIARVQMLWRQITITQTQVSTSEENMKLARTRYEGGEGPALDVVASQQQLQQARVNYFTVLADYSNARADLEVATGR